MYVTYNNVYIYIHTYFCTEGSAYNGKTYKTIKITWAYAKLFI